MGSSAPSELSLTTARAQFFAATEDERIVQLEHQRLLRAHIDESIENGHRYSVYEVPSTIPGFFIEYDVMEITLWLIRKARKSGFTVQLLTTLPPTFRIEGWCPEEWLHDSRPPGYDKDGADDKHIAIQRGPQRRVVPQRPKLPRPSLPRPATTARVTPEDASRRAQQGFSRRLQERFSKLQRQRPSP